MIKLKYLTKYLDLLILNGLAHLLTKNLSVRIKNS